MVKKPTEKLQLTRAKKNIKEKVKSNLRMVINWTNRLDAH